MLRNLLIAATLCAATQAKALEIDFAEVARLQAPCIDHTAKPLEMIACMKKASDPYWYGLGLSSDQIAAGEANYAKAVSEYVEVESGKLTLAKWMKQSEERERTFIKSLGVRYPKIEMPTWRERPKAKILKGHFPRAALAAQQDGSAKLLCTVAQSGAVEQCVVQSESPEGFHFGAATLALSQHFKFKPLRIDGKPIGGIPVIIPVTYRHAGFFKLAPPSKKELAEAFAPSEESSP